MTKRMFVKLNFYIQIYDTVQTCWKEYTEWKSGLTYANLGFGLFAATAAQRSIPTVHRREPIIQNNIWTLLVLFIKRY